MLYEEVLLLQRGEGVVKMEALAAVVSRMFVKYWIYVCGTMFFFVSFEGKIVLYKVIYMVMFLCCVALYQVRLQVLLLLPLLYVCITTVCTVCITTTLNYCVWIPDRMIGMTSGL